MSISFVKNLITKEKSEPKRLSLAELIMVFAMHVKTRSTCQRAQVGAIITDKTMRHIKGFGYNGGYTGGLNKCESSEPGHCGCIHGECNALINSRFREERDIMFITNSPCYQCAKLIINAGIRTVYYHLEYRLLDGLKLLRKSGIKVVKL